jgi:hypothetical protein
VREIQRAAPLRVIAKGERDMTNDVGILARRKRTDESENVAILYLMTRTRDVRAAKVPDANVASKIWIASVVTRQERAALPTESERNAPRSQASYPEAVRYVSEHPESTKPAKHVPRAVEEPTRSHDSTSVPYATDPLKEVDYSSSISHGERVVDEGNAIHRREPDAKPSVDTTFQRSRRLERYAARQPLPHDPPHPPPGIGNRVRLLQYGLKRRHV